MGGRGVARGTMSKVLLLQAAVLICVFQPTATKQLSDISLGSREHGLGKCAMYGVCGERSDGKELNCPYSTLAVTPSEALSHKIQSLCPTLTGDVCCSSDQFERLREHVQQAVPFLTGCPACLRNYLDLFCEIACSPDQSLFIDVTSIEEVSFLLCEDIAFHEVIFACSLVSRCLISSPQNQ
jgi:Niemann-Pick C1 protein